ncbi:hypothetical protein [uncultured Propionivibrio sp.]|uniref:hypothetical protein n=1 Tax=uncultured Propionivibrio sp. TaxID=426737 RepID=UPI0029BFFDFC|nr:hypothetical protein [uncultured Propionivibrio sp.]
MTCDFNGYSCEGIGALASAVIAVFALVATVWQAWVTRKHNRLSVKPLLNTWSETNGGAGIYEARLKNIGIGPAIIDSFEVRVDDKMVEGNGLDVIDSAVKAMFPSNAPSVLYKSCMAKGGALGAGEGITIVRIQFSPLAMPTYDEFEQMKKRVRLTVRYKSIYKHEQYSYDSTFDHL